MKILQTEHPIQSMIMTQAKVPLEMNESICSGSIKLTGVTTPRAKGVRDSGRSGKTGGIRHRSKSLNPQTTSPQRKRSSKLIAKNHAKDLSIRINCEKHKEAPLLTSNAHQFESSNSI